MLSTSRRFGQLFVQRTTATASGTHNGVHADQTMAVIELAKLNADDRDRMDGRLERALDRFSSALSSSVASMKSSNDNMQMDILRKIGDLDSKIDGLQKEVDRKIDGLQKDVDRKIDGMQKEVDSKIDGMQKDVNSKIDGMGIKVDSLKSRFSFISGGAAVLVALGSLYGVLSKSGLSL